MNRRTFLLSSAAVVVAGEVRAEPKPMLPVVDTHQHLWDFTKLKLTWLKLGEADNPLSANFTQVEYAAATKDLNVVKSVYMEVDVVPEDKRKEADYVVQICEAAKTTMRSAVIGGRPGEDGFAKYITPYKGHKFVKGVRQVLPAGFDVTPAFTKSIQLLGDLGLSWDICVPPTELVSMSKLVEACPGTRFILDHCGNASVKFTAAEKNAWTKGMTALAAKKNVVACKLSGFVVNGGPGPWTAEQLAPIVNDTIAIFGPDRCVFGGDWPVVLRASSYKDWLTNLRTILASRSENEQRAILAGNAERVYGV